jgi:quercetin dioxygenase-like cupin family protein
VNPCATAGVVRPIAGGQWVPVPWGASFIWLVSGELMPGAEQTVGIVRIDPRRESPLHGHRNCEEVLYVVSGECEHRLGGRCVRLGAGSAIRIARGVAHRARCLGSIGMTDMDKRSVRK